MLVANLLTTPYITQWPGRTRPELVVDTDRMFLFDPATSTLLGYDTTWGPGGPLQRMVYAARTEGTRDL
jgi:hypothetical protein